MGEGEGQLIQGGVWLVARGWENHPGQRSPCNKPDGLDSDNDEKATGEEGQNGANDD